MKFQSTLLRRERQKFFIIAFHVCYFNPRSRVGSDQVVTLNRRLHPYFNPRSRVGSDPVSKGRIKLDEIEFQSTLPRRERQMDLRNCLLPPVFQSTLPRRERRKTANYFLKIPFTFIYILHIFYSTHFFSKTEFRFSTKFQCEYPCIFNITSVSHLSILITTAPGYILT